MTLPHREHHSIDRTGRLRAAVLGADDGLVSTASLIVGVAASASGASVVLVAGAMSMAVAERGGIAS